MSNQYLMLPQTICTYPIMHHDWRPVEGFHVMSYEANFASHHTCDRHAGFLFAWSGIGKYNKMSLYFLFSSYHNTKLQLRNISPHTLGWNFKSWYEVNQKKECFLLFFSTPRHTKRKPRGGTTESHAWKVRTASCKPSVYGYFNFLDCAVTHWVEHPNTGLQSKYIMGYPQMVYSEMIEILHWQHFFCYLELTLVLGGEVEASNYGEFFPSSPHGITTTFCPYVFSTTYKHDNEKSILTLSSFSADWNSFIDSILSVTLNSPFYGEE